MDFIAYILPALLLVVLIGSIILLAMIAASGLIHEFHNQFDYLNAEETDI